MLYDITDSFSAETTLRNILRLGPGDSIPTEIPPFDKSSCPLAYRRVLGLEGLKFRAKHITTCKNPDVFRKHGILPLAEALDLEETDISTFLAETLQVRYDSRNETLLADGKKRPDLAGKLQYDNRVNGYLYCGNYYSEFDSCPEFLKEVCHSLVPAKKEHVLSLWKAEREAYAISFDIDFRSVNSTSLFEIDCEEEEFYESLTYAAMQVYCKENICDSVITLAEGRIVPLEFIVDIELLPH